MAASPAPQLSRELAQMPRTPRPRRWTPTQIAQTIAELYAMGLIEEEIDGQGVPRFKTIEKAV